MFIRRTFIKKSSRFDDRRLLPSILRLDSSSSSEALVFVKVAHNGLSLAFNFIVPF